MAVIERFKAETFPPLATVVIPGTVTIGPFILIAVARSHTLQAFMEKHEVSFGTIVVFAAVAAGLILEDLGANLEEFWDKRQGDKIENKRIWNEYLRTAFVHEPIGRRYLRSIVLRMKFELSFGISLIFMLVGLLLLNDTVPFASWLNLVWIGLATLGVAVYLFFESYRSSVLLAELRREILKGIRVVGTQTEQAPS